MNTGQDTKILYLLFGMFLLPIRNFRENGSTYIGSCAFGVISGACKIKTIHTKGTGFWYPALCVLMVGLQHDT